MKGFDSPAGIHCSKVLRVVEIPIMFLVKIDKERVVRMTEQQLAAWCRNENWDAENQLSDEFLVDEAVQCEIAQQMTMFNPAQEAKERALFVAYFYWAGYHTKSLWETFDSVYALSGEFVQTYSPDDTWEDASFEEFMDEFIKDKVDDRKREKMRWA